MFSGMVRKCLVLHPASRESHWILNKYKDPSSFNAIRSWGHMLFFYPLVCLTFMFIPYKVHPPLWKVFKSSPFFKTSLLLILVLSNATAPQIAVNFSPSYTHTWSLIEVVPILWLFKVVVLWLHLCQPSETVCLVQFTYSTQCISFIGHLCLTGLERHSIGDEVWGNRVLA